MAGETSDGERGRTMVDQAAAREIFEHELAALTDAEEKTAEILGKIVPQIHSLKLQQLIANYQQVSTGQVKRLADIFKLLKVTPQKAPSVGMDGLIATLGAFWGVTYSSLKMSASRFTWPVETCW